MLAYFIYTINLSLSTDLVDPPPMGTFYMKHALATCTKYIIFESIIDIFQRVKKAQITFHREK